MSMKLVSFENLVIYMIPLIALVVDERNLIIIGSLKSFPLPNGCH